jgi:hypothetical protein
MTIDNFITTLSAAEPPSHLPIPLRALWLARQGRWDDAHTTVQDEQDSSSAWVHAYLHRSEGDDWNARYWYSQAKRKPFAGTLESEWEDMVKELLSRG